VAVLPWLPGATVEAVPPSWWLVLAAGQSFGQHVVTALP
jgi:hypothetical protein